MVELGKESVVFPVVLYDGGREMNVGNIEVHESLDFKQFQMMRKETTGISYNNLTTYLIDSKKSSERRKVLITGKVNFSVLVRERNCYFLVVLKRSRRDCRRKPNKQIAFTPAVSPEYLFHLRRNQFDLIDEQMAYGYQNQFHDFQMMNDKYINQVLNWNHVFNSPLNANFPKVDEDFSTVSSGGSRALCEECTRAEEEGSEAAFHFCVYDDVVTGGFRSPVGPISRPH